MSAVAAASLTSVALLAEMLHRTEDHRINPCYKNEFTERRCASSVLHPGNAYSSAIYTALGAMLLWNGSSERPWCCAVEGATLLWFSWLSYHYHATELEWAGALDITMVIHLCVSCLVQCLGLGDLACVALAWAATGGLLANVWSHRAEPERSVPVRCMVPLLAPLVLALLHLQAAAGAWARFGAFGAGFAVKLLDRRLAPSRRCGMVNGTSAFHLLTGLAMCMHYRRVLLLAP